MIQSEPGQRERHSEKSYGGRARRRLNGGLMISLIEREIRVLIGSGPREGDGCSRQHTGHPCHQRDPGTDRGPAAGRVPVQMQMSDRQRETIGQGAA